jgi:acyl carrier protein
MTGSHAVITGQIRQILVAITGRAELTDLPAGTALFGAGIGLDSLAGTLLLRRVEREFGVDVAGEDMNLDALETLGTLAAFIAERAG